MKQEIQEFFNLVLKDNVYEARLMLENNLLLVRARDEEGNTPLHLASSVAMVNLLTCKGADPRKINKREFSPDECARDRGQAEIQNAILRSWPGSPPARG